MVYLYIRHTVNDFNKWYDSFKLSLETYEDIGLTEMQLFQDKKDYNDVIIIFKVDDIEKAKSFLFAPDKELANEEAGVIGEPETLFLEKL